MATASVTASLLCRSTFAFLVIFLGCFQHVSCYAPSIEVTCKSTVDLGNNNFDAGLIVSMLPPRIPIYAQEEERCDVYLSIPTGHEMMLYFDWLDLYSGELSKCDTTNIELFDGSANNYVKGLNRKICGREEQMPTNVYFLENNFLVIRVNALGTIQGTGFRIHFTISRRAFPCSNDEFACETFGSRRCIAEHLVCDDWNDCGDWVDEEQNCNNITAGGIAAIVVASLLLIALIIGLIIFCKIRRQHELREMSEKEAAIMRDQSIASGGMVSPFSVSSETMEKAPYMPRYSSGRNSGRRSQASVRNIDTDDRPPPYTEKPSFDDSRSEGGLYEDQDAPRTRRKSRNRESTPDDVFVAEEDVPRTRRGRSKSTERAPSRVEEEPVREERYHAREGGRHPSRRDDRDSPPEDSRYPREKDDRLPSRRDDRDSPRSDHYSRDRDDRYPPRRDDNESRHSREDDLERERDRYPSRRDDRDRDRDDRYSRRRDDRDRDEDRYPSRRDDRDRDRESDRDSRRDRPRSRREPSPDEYGGVPDQLHPLRDLKRRSMHSDSDQDTSREDRRSREDVRPHPRDDRHNRSRDREDRPRDDRYPPRDRDDRYPSRDRDDRPPPVRDDRSPSTRDDRPVRDERSPSARDDRPVRDDRSPSIRDDRPVRDERSPSARDDRPASTRADRADRPRDTPTSRSKDPTPDDSYESAQEVPPASNRGRRARPDARDTPPPPPPEEKQPELAPEELPSRRRRRRSRSRDGQDRPRSSRHGEEPEEGGGRRSKAPMAQMDDEPRRPGGRQSMGGYKEETV